DEEGLRDLTVCRACGRHLGDAALAGRERVDAAQSDAARARPGGEELALAPRSELRGTTDRRQFDGVPKLFPGLGASVGSTQRGAELGTRLRVLEPRRRLAQCLHRLLEQREPALAALDQSRRTKGRAKRPGGAPGA